MPFATRHSLADGCFQAYRSEATYNYKIACHMRFFKPDGGESDHGQPGKGKGTVEFLQRPKSQNSPKIFPRT